MLPTGKPGSSTALQIILYTLWTIVVSVFPVLGLTGALQLSVPGAIAVALAGFALLWFGLTLYRNQNQSNAKKLLIVSIVYITVLQWIYVLDKFL